MPDTIQQQFDYDLKIWLETAKTRQGFAYTADVFQKDAKGNTTTIKGTVTFPATDEIPATANTTLIPAKPEETKDMYWNISGIATGNARGCDLIQEVAIADIVAPVPEEQNQGG